MKAIDKNVVPLVARLLSNYYAARCERKKTFTWLSAAPTLSPESALAQIYRKLTGRSWENPGAAQRPRLLTLDAYFGAPLNIGFEFDEDAHFNRWRELALGSYPADAPLNFNMRFSLEHCREDRPGRGAGPQRRALPLFPGRDGWRKQQAFHDAIVDLLPPAHGLNPTLRIAQAELVDNPRQELREQELEKRLASLLDQRVAMRASTTFLNMLRHPSAKPWVPTLIGS